MSKWLACMLLMMRWTKFGEGLSTLKRTVCWRLGNSARGWVSSMLVVAAVKENQMYNGRNPARQ
ncbi:uncharacterized protein N7500_004615 [Penicillium coprophilum]|uniref:uncharacterized protein n=1 Tax=Penicillium coprophilum TaxID=36646 RepID=UPI0023A4FFBB|nr:uncharacterized protein N7500_004615 [Penicillium coprophilum]KAJ5162785.1 hypothetical protein N7500_004615 [Penicillium coprophilum]